ncbi:MAG: cytochrome c biogenesis protein ResB [Syntrophobacterales bacterium]|nr:cytochrome c biogenesis protein ResB [Syntrophobacterales bacterium]
MSRNSPPRSLPGRLWDFLTSIRLTVTLLLILAVVATLGTVIPQNEPVARYLVSFGPRWGPVLLRLGLHRIYDGPWLLMPVALLSLNLLACVIRGLPEAVRRVARPFTLEAALQLPLRGQFTLPARVNPETAVLPALRQELGRLKVSNHPGRQVYYWESGRFRPLGPYLIHLSLFLILLGALVGKFLGVEGRLAILTGETATEFTLAKGKGSVPLGFTLRLDDFRVEYYGGTATPREFRSDLTFMQDGQEVGRAACRVNHPVTFGGLTFYQSSYGSQLAGPVRLKVCKGQECHTLTVGQRRGENLPDGQGQVMLVRVDANFQGLGPAALLAYREASGGDQPQLFWIPARHPELARRLQTPFYQAGPHLFTVEELPLKFYSVFQVRRDPGVWWVYAGFLLCLPGFVLAFLRPSQRLAVVLEQSPKGHWQGRLLGASPRAREVFQERVDRLLMHLKKGTAV